MEYKASVSVSDPGNMLGRSLGNRMGRERTNRVLVSVKKMKDRVILDVKAKDAVMVRASVDSFLRLCRVFEAMESVA